MKWLKLNKTSGLGDQLSDEKLKILSNHLGISPLYRYNLEESDSAIAMNHALHSRVDRFGEFDTDYTHYYIMDLKDGNWSPFDQISDKELLLPFIAYSSGTYKENELGSLIVPGANMIYRDINMPFVCGINTRRDWGFYETEDNLYESGGEGYFTLEELKYMFSHYAMWDLPSRTIHG